MITVCCALIVIGTEAVYAYISAMIRHDLGSVDLELLCCDLRLPKFKPIVVDVCYKQNDFIEKLEEEHCSKLELI